MSSRPPMLQLQLPAGDSALQAYALTDSASASEPAGAGAAPEPLDPTFPLTGVGIETKDTVPSAEAAKYGNPKFTTDILMYLDAHKVKLLQKEFDRLDDDGLHLHEFVCVMKSFLKSAIAAGPESSLQDLTDMQLVANLCELFDQIDVNGDGSMEWDEFTSYVVEMGMHVSADDGQNSIARYRAADVTDTSKHPSTVSYLKYMPKLDMIGVCERDVSMLKLYDHNLNLKRTLSREDGEILAVEHIPELNQLVTTSTDLQMTLYDDASCRLQKTFHTPSSQLCLTWAPEVRTLFSAGVNGVVHAWDPEYMEEKHSMGGRSRDGTMIKGSHEDIVLDVLNIPQLETISSASMDKSIRLWDRVTGKLRKTLLGHKKGIRSLAYSPDFRFMISAGFDYDALVWNPYVEKVIAPLHGHNASLIGVETVPGTPQIVTADMDGVLKLWDIRNFACIQTFDVDDVDSINASVSLDSHRRIVVGGRMLHACDYEKLENPELSHDNAVVGACYNQTSSTFLTAGLKDVKVWDATSGELQRVYRHLTETDITSITLDDRERKFIIGDADGAIKVFDYMNGAEMKQLHKHDGEVVAVDYCTRDKCVISASHDKSVAVIDEMVADKGVLLKHVTGSHEHEIGAMAYSQRLSLYATASVDCSLRVWDFEFGKIIGLCHGHTVPVTALAFCDPYPILISADSNGGISLWGVPPGPVRYQCVARFTTADVSAGSSLVTAPISTASAIVTDMCIVSEWRDMKRGEYPEAPRPTSTISVAKTMTFSSPLSSPPSGKHVDFAAAASGESPRKMWGHASYGINHGKVVESLVVYAGDDHGFVTAWNLLPILKRLEAHGIQPLFTDNNTPFPRRNAQFDTQSAIQALSNGQDLSPYLDAKKVGISFYFPRGYPLDMSAPPVAHQWKAHADTVLSIRAIEQPPSLITASFDCRAKVWSCDSQLLGCLEQGRRDPSWKFQVDTAAKVQRFEERAQAALDTIEKEIAEEEIARLEHVLESKPGGKKRKKHRRKPTASLHKRAPQRFSPRRPRHSSNQKRRGAGGRGRRSSRVLLDVADETVVASVDGVSKPQAGEARFSADRHDVLVANRAPLLRFDDMPEDDSIGSSPRRRGIQKRRASLDFLQIDTKTLEALVAQPAEVEFSGADISVGKSFRRVPSMRPIDAKSAGRVGNASFYGAKSRTIESHRPGSLSARARSPRRNGMGIPSLPSIHSAR